MFLQQMRGAVGVILVMDFGIQKWICLDNEYGDILLNEKNILLIDTVSEKIAATRHSNGSDYWVVTHKYFSDAFYALRLTPNGITEIIISNTGSIHSGSIAGSQGQLKFSSSGHLLAIAASNGNNLLELFDFDNSTGIISNYRSLIRADNGSVYGIEFSADNSKLYALSWSFSPFGMDLNQYDLAGGGGNINVINASRFSVYEENSIVTGKGLQIGPDSKIYMVSLTDERYLAVINKPNLYGPDCDFQDQAIYLNGTKGSYTLPGFIANYDYSNQMVNCENSHFIFPNAFTPNGDNLNDKFQPITQNIFSYTLTIYNRWGEIVYYSTALNLGWDGSSKGVSQPQGIYYYIAEGIDKSGNLLKRSGEVALFR